MRDIIRITAATLLVALFCVSPFGLTSCLWRSSGGSGSVGEGGTAPIAPGVQVTATIISDRDEIEKRFKSFLPDSGIVPLEVKIHNGTECSLMIHTSHDLRAPEPFHGFTLETAGTGYAPLAPLDALAILMGEGKRIRYSRPGVFDAVVGIAVPPAIFVYGHREMSVGRRYRSLFKHSIFEATDGGAIVPILIEPGAEISGFLFFYLPGDANPFPAGKDVDTSIDTSSVAEFTLTVRPNDARSFDEVPGVEGWSDASAAYIPDPPAGAGSGAGERDGIIFVMPKGGKWRGGGLLAGWISLVLEKGESAMIGLSEGLSSKARIVGAAARGDHAICAVNFKASSRIYLLDVSGPPALVEEIELNRKVERALLTDEAILVATSDDRCRYISLDGMKQRRNIKSGKRVRDMFLDGDALFVLGEEELSAYSAVASDPLRLVERRSILKSDRRFVGMDGDIVYIIHESGNAGRDTLAAYERESLEEMSRMILPASAGFTEVGSGHLLLQLDGGALLRVVFHGESREFEAVVAGHLPFEIALVRTGDNGYTILGKDGTLARGDIVPSILREYVTTVPVGVKIPEVTSSRSRSRR